MSPVHAPYPWEPVLETAAEDELVSSTRERAQPGVATLSQQSADSQLLAGALATTDTENTRGKRSALDAVLDEDTLDDDLLAALASG